MGGGVFGLNTACQPQCAQVSPPELPFWRGSSHALLSPFFWLEFSRRHCSVQRCCAVDSGPLRRLFPSLCQSATPVLFQLPLSLLKLKVIEVAQGCCSSSFLPRPRAPPAPHSHPPSSPPPCPPLPPPSLPSSSSPMWCSREPSPTLERLLLAHARSSSGSLRRPLAMAAVPTAPAPLRSRGPRRCSRSRRSF